MMTLSAPRAAPAAPPATPPTEFDPAKRPATILIVDDEPRNVVMIRELLKVGGFKVRSAEDGEIALKVIEMEAPDLILLDVMLPGMDGFTVCRHLKDNPATVFIPVIILTALKGTQERIKGASAGADEFLSKPFDSVELLTRVKSLLRVKYLNDQLKASNTELERRVAARTAELENAVTQLRELDRLKSEFISNVSHELRTPLLHVKGYVDLLADGAMGTLTAKQQEGLGVAKEAIEQLERVVEDIVDFSSIHEQQLTLEPIYLTDLCRNVIHSAGAMAARRQATVQLIAPPEALRVQADRVALTRILRHLLDNALKFGPLHQTVQIELTKQPKAARITVRDHGPGLSPPELGRIFDMFYQVDGSTTRRAGGLGVGLSLVRKLVEAHGARIQVSSDVGQGSAFYFDLTLCYD
jgi:signal transduction histidine kinase